MSRFEELVKEAQEQQEKVDELWRSHLQIALKIRRALIDYLEIPEDLIKNCLVDRTRQDIFVTPNAHMYAVDGGNGFFQMPMALTWGPNPIHFTIGVQQYLASNEFAAFIAIEGDIPLEAAQTNIGNGNPEMMEPMLAEFYGSLKALFENAIAVFRNDHKISGLKYLRDYGKHG